MVYCINIKGKDESYIMKKNNMNSIILLIGILLLSYAPSIISARPEYAAKESRNCPYCHSSEGPPQLNEIGTYYGMHNHSFEGYIPSPKMTPTPQMTAETEIGVHMNTWDVGLQVFVTIFFILIVVYAIRL
jgi:hypothetical protein